MYECLVGYTPFFADDAHTTCRKILAWRKYLALPAEASERLSSCCVNFMAKLITDRKHRCASLDELSRQPWVQHLDFANLRKMRAPRRPDFLGTCDFPQLLASLKTVDLHDQTTFMPLITAVTANFDHPVYGPNAAFNNNLDPPSPTPHPAAQPNNIQNKQPIETQNYCRQQSPQANNIPTAVARVADAFLDYTYRRRRRNSSAAGNAANSAQNIICNTITALDSLSSPQSENETSLETSTHQIGVKNTTNLSSFESFTKRPTLAQKNAPMRRGPTSLSGMSSGAFIVADAQL